MQDTDKSSEPAEPGPYLEDQVDGKDHKILHSETTQVCPKNSKSGLEEESREMHPDITEEALARPKIPAFTHDYKLRPRMKKI